MMPSISLLEMEVLKWGVNPWNHMEAFTTDATQAKCWTLSRNGAVDEILGPQEFSKKLVDIKTALKQSADSPTFILITAIGDPNKEFSKRRNCPLHITNNGQPTGDFDLLNNLLGMNTVTYGVYTTARQNCSYVLEYDDALQNLQAIIFLVRCPILSRSIVCVMRVQIPTLSCVAFVCCPHAPDLDRLRDSCKASHVLLRASPLGLLALIYEQRGLDYEGWVTRVALESHEIEVFMRMSPPGWTYHRLSPSRYKELSDTDRLLSRLQSTDIEICHGHSIMTFAVRFGKFCTEALDVIEGKPGVPKLAPGARAMVEDRIRFSISRCLSVRERFEELTHRHRGQINAVRAIPTQQQDCQASNLT
ncbi:hypothetical protein DL546_006347 [Coniochaeta pulveracea]|uniref:Uncharacterized protein n=1 Tax=Coniochaeta pulveracea TaxID=177199 RepID=A0A420YLQ1_9PEZI|nr:hypothetical protein DL546_006347 [Coniochaeta pulveracea]